MPIEINLHKILEQLGIEELSSIKKEELAADFLPAAVVGFADGDIVAVHPEYTGKKAELYGRNHLGEGRVAQALTKAALENGEAPHVAKRALSI